MEKLQVKLKNCFGIKELVHEFKFDKSNVNVIYAKNGLMKTSFSKTFKKIQDKMESEIKDEIFNAEPSVSDIYLDENKIESEEIFVIKSFENAYESDSIASLLINSDMKTKLLHTLKIRDSLYKTLEKKSGLKVSKVSAGKKVYELEPKLISDFKFTNNSFLLNLDSIELGSIDYDYSHIEYISIFDDGVYKKITNTDFQGKINDFVVKSDEIYSEFIYLEKGMLTLPKLKEIEKNLKKHNFFIKENMLILTGDIEVTDVAKLSENIKIIEQKLQETAEFKELEKLLSDVKGMALRDIIENNPWIISELRSENLDEFRLKLWYSYLKSESGKFTELNSSLKSLIDEVNQTDMNETAWAEALEIFNNRFSVPFEMSVCNPISSIIGESIPKIAFTFYKDGNRDNKVCENCVELTRDEIEIKDTLSQGEKRALYLLNIIFDIENRRRNQIKTLFIIDDIADSFDYKNKYAIVEYLKEISEVPFFNLIILSHNFDFYRTVSSRLDIGRDNKLIANTVNDIVTLRVEKYQNQPFNTWKTEINKSSYIALIPFVRNIIEYGKDWNKNTLSGIQEDYIFLTNLLHQKDYTKSITNQMLLDLFSNYIEYNHVVESVQSEESVYNTIISCADSVTTNDNDLENKIVLAMATRLLAEDFMLRKITSSEIVFKWRKGKTTFEGDKTEFLAYVSTKSNQTRELFNGFQQLGTQEDIELFDRVNIMTPENIHINSFMYEPILDMDIVELLSLFNSIKQK